MVRISLMPKEHRFFDLFERGAHNMVEAAQHLKDLVDNWENAEAKVDEITEIEHQGDSITHEIIAQLNRTFVTPFDREDISLLAHSVDDVTDFIQAAADAMLVYKIGCPGQRAKELADTIVLATVAVEKAMSHLRNQAQFKQMLTECVEINRLENVADRVYRAALGELFDGTDIASIIKWREIYEHMESATDRCEDVANVLEGVALKQA
ncbi:MAG: DUF47 domain-containing protein [Chloroflexi bacterium]|nr:DUF47 domain-containing protein [Chloroflexota bacterium]